MTAARGTFFGEWMVSDQREINCVPLLARGPAEQPKSPEPTPAHIALVLCPLQSDMPFDQRPKQVLKVLGRRFGFALEEVQEVPAVTQQIAGNQAIEKGDS
jgi:hypothetical protein